MPAYGVKYRIEIGCVAGGIGTTETYRLDIEKNGYSSSITDLTSSSTPIELNWPGGNNDFAPIKPSEVLINIVVDGEDLSEFISYDDQEYQVKLYNNTNQLKWTGWLTSKYGYLEDWSIPEPRVLQLRAIDGIGLMQEIEYRDSSGDLQTGRATAFSILQEGFENYWPDTTAGNTLMYVDSRTINDGQGGWSSPVPVEAKNPLKIFYFDRTRYMHDKDTPWTWFEVFQSILTEFSAFLTNGFHIHAYPVIIVYERWAVTKGSYNANMTLLNYNNISAWGFNQNDSKKFLTNINSQDGTATDNIFRGQKATYDQPIAFIDVAIKKGNPNMVKDGNFEISAWSDSTTLKNWEKVGTITTTRTTETEDFSVRSLKFTQSTSNKATAEGIRSLSGSRAINSSTGQIGIRFKYWVQVTDSFPDATLNDNPAYGIAIFCGGRYLQTDLVTWEATQTILWQEIAGSNLNAWATDNFGLIDTPSEGGEIIVELYETYKGDYTISYIKWDEITIVQYDNGIPIDINEYTDIKGIAENTANASKGRHSITIHNYDYPSFVLHNFTSATYANLVVDFDSTFTNGDNIAFKLDGSSYTFTYQGSPGGTGSRDFNTVARFVQEVNHITSNYNARVVVGGDANDELHITALVYAGGSKSFDPVTINDPSSDWSYTSISDVSPTTAATFTSKAAISINSDGTTPTTPEWFPNGGLGTLRLWEFVSLRLLNMMGTQNERLTGRLMVFNEGTDQFGALTGIIAENGEDAYCFMRGSLNLKMLEWDGEWLKINDNSPTMSYTEFE